MPSAYFAGMRGTGSFGTDERPKSFRELIMWMNPAGSAPLFAMTSKMKTESVNDPEFSWWEEVNTICRLRLNGAIADGVDTTWVVDAAGTDSGARELIPGDVLQVETAEAATYAPELVRVVSIQSDTAFTVVRGFAGTTPAAIADNVYLTRIGNAQGEGSLSPSSSSSNPTKYTNKTQIFKTPYQINNTALATEFRTGDPKKNEQKRKMFQHAEKIEQALLWGIQSEGVDADGNILRTMGGLRSMIASNKTIFSVDPTLTTFQDAVLPVFNYEAGAAGNERIVYAGNGALNYLNTLVANGSKTNINYDGIVKFYGMDLAKYVLPQGTLYFKSHPLMNVHPVYTNSMFVVNPSGLIYRPLKGRDTHIEKEIQPNDADYTKDQWLTEASIEMHFERTFAYIGGFYDHP